jgi:Preprotein translocase subunit YajC
MDPTMIAILGIMVLLFIWMSYSGRKARERMNKEREEIIVVGNNIMTTAGFYGKIVDIDGDAITLQSPAGDETVWDRRAIARLAELPLAEEEDGDSDGENEDVGEGADSQTESADLKEESVDSMGESASPSSSPSSSDR